MRPEQETAFADIVPPSFRQHEFQLEIQQMRQKREILVHQLFLQIQRLGRDQHRLLHRQRRIDGRDQVGETLSDSGRRLDAEIPSALKCRRDFVRHDGLLRSGFIRMTAEVARVFQRAVLREEGGGLFQTVRTGGPELLLRVQFHLHPGEIQRVRSGILLLCVRLFTLFGKAGRCNHRVLDSLS